MSAAEEVVRLPFVSATSFHGEFLHKQPFVATAMLQHWPASKTFTPERFRRELGDVKITLGRYGRDRSETFLYQTTLTKQSMTLGRWIDVMEGSATFDDTPSAWSIRESYELFVAAPSLAGELDFAGLFPRGHKRFRHYLWLGPRDYATGLHTDEVAINLLAHLHGRKTVVLYDPVQSHLLYAETRDGVDEGRYSAVNVFAPSREDHPLFFEARPVTAELFPGDLLYIPRGWWHWVLSHDVTVSVSGVSITV